MCKIAALTTASHVRDRTGMVGHGMGMEDEGELEVVPCLSNCSGKLVPSKENVLQSINNHQPE